MLIKVEYSSEAKTKPKFKVSDVGTKSNSITAASLIELTEKFCPIRGGTELATCSKSASVIPVLVRTQELFNAKEEAQPLDKMTPLSSPITL